jgi:hypothetical protein
MRLRPRLERRYDSLTWRMLSNRAANAASWMRLRACWRRRSRSMRCLIVWSGHRPQPRECAANQRSCRSPHPRTGADVHRPRANRRDEEACAGRFDGSPVDRAAGRRLVASRRRPATARHGTARHGTAKEHRDSGGREGLAAPHRAGDQRPDAGFGHGETADPAVNEARLAGLA